MNCTLCSSNQTKKVLQLKSSEINAIYSLYECPECESRFCDLNEHPEINMSSFYKNITPVFDQKLQETFTPSSYWSAQKCELIDVLGRQPENILDIGCRGGDFLMHFEPTCSREGIEQSPIGSTIAQKRGLTVHQGFIETVSIENKYDIVTAYAVMEHISNPVSVLNKLADFVKESGVLCIMIPSYQCLKVKLLTLLNRQWYQYDPPGHITYYSKRFLDNYLLPKGFALERRYYTSGGVAIKPFLPAGSIRKSSRVVYKWRNAFNVLMGMCDNYLKFYPVFDHMYSIYRKH